MPTRLNRVLFLLGLVFVGAGCSSTVEPTPSSSQVQTTTTAPAQVTATTSVETELKNNYIPAANLRRFTREQGESAAAFAFRTLGPDEKMAHEAVPGTLQRVEDSILVLTQEEGLAAVGFNAYALVPVKKGGMEYGKFTMPRAYRGEAYTTVDAVFFANADADKSDQEVVVLVSLMTGVGPTGAQPWNEAYVYDWNGKEYYVIRSLEKELQGLYPASAVKSKLKQLGF